MAQPLASASASSSASSHGNYSYQIFINHRGEVKKKFASHLYRRLLREGFRVFLDQPELQRGEEIDSQIEGAIATASVHVAILSSGYAQSRWCLDELVLMLKSKKDGTATVIPIFYDVKPSEVRWTKEGTDNNVGYAQALRILRWTGIDRVYSLALRVLRWTGIHRLYAPALSFLMLSLVFYNVKPSDLRWADNGKNSKRVCAEALRILRQTGRYRVFVHALRILRWTGKDSMYVQALRNQCWTSRVYAEAFRNHEKKGRYRQERVAGWRKALYDVSHISGFELEACNGDEGVLEDEVVRQVQKKVRKPPLTVATHQTGLDEKLQQLLEKVFWEQQHNRGGPKLVGIVGLGGVGKTTLAKFFFNSKSSDYQRSCFLPDVRDAAANCRLSSWQSKLYKDLAGVDQVIDNVEEGKATLEHRLSCGQALVVLDDVDGAKQLDALFSPLKVALPPDSLILVTSRNREFLRKSARIEESSIYMMTGLDLPYSQQLFCSYAFQHPDPPVEYVDLVIKFLETCQGLPLSLIVIGALLYSESREYWEVQLSKLSEVPTEIQRSLMISYDSLGKEEKEMFLDIACFFIGIKKDTAINVWNGSGWKGSVGLGTLESKCLVTFDEENCIRMHDHLRDLGRELAELPGCPRRLWRPTDSLFRNVPTTSTVRGLSMIRQRSGESSQSPSEFKDRSVDMSGLQLLRAPADCLERIFKVIRHPELLWLRCEIDYKGDSLPSWIQIYPGIQRYPPGIEINSCLSSWIPIKNLRVLELVFSEGCYSDEFLPLVAGTLWNTEYEAPLQLRELNISIGLFELPKSIGQLKYLQKIELHDFRGTLPEEFFHLCSLKHLRLRALMGSLSDSLRNFTSLQHIDLSHCELLQELPPSFGNLAMLQHIDLSCCRELQTLPASIGNLKQVQYINLSWCENLQRLPQSFGDLTNLQKVILAQCGKLEMLPDPMNLTRLKHLDLSSCSNLILTGQTLENVSTLERLDFSHCGKMEKLPSQVTRQQFLKELILKDRNLEELPNDIGDLSNLELLDISSPSLETLPRSLGKLMKLKKLSIDAPIREVTFASVEKVQGGRRLLDSCIDKCMPRLKQLDLLKTRITEISFGEGVCPVLENLSLRDCDELVEVGGLPTTLTSLDLKGCRALKKLRGFHGLAKLRYLNM